MLGSALSADEFRLTSCKDGDEGIKVARRETPDLVVIDIDIPGRSGLDVMTELRADPDTANVPILSLSAVDDENMVVQALRWADDFVLKPFKPLELKVRIQKILDRSHGGSRVMPAHADGVPNRIPVHIGQDTYLVPLEQIFFFEASGKYAYATTRNKRFLTGHGIGELEEQLRPTGRFLRIHRSFVINIDCVFKVTRDERKNMFVVMSDDKGAELRVSDSYLRDVKLALGI